MNTKEYDEMLKRQIIDSDYNFDTICTIKAMVDARVDFLYCLMDEYKSEEVRALVAEQFERALDMSGFVARAMLLTGVKGE